MEYIWEEKSNYFTICFVRACVFLRGNTPTDVVLIVTAFISMIPKSELQAFFFPPHEHLSFSRSFILFLSC